MKPLVFILILLVGDASGVPRLDVETQEFKDEPACVSAGEAFLTMKEGHRYVHMDYRCVPKWTPQ